MDVTIAIAILSGLVALVCMTLGNLPIKTQPVEDQPSNWRLLEQWENYPTPDYGATHTYCKVRLKENGKLVYYRTRNPELQKGDLICVPFGRRQERKVGRIVAMRRCIGYFAPHPLEKTNYIIGKIRPRRSHV